MGVEAIYKNYDKDIGFLDLPKDIEEQIKHNQIHGYVSPYAFKDQDIVRRVKKDHDKATVVRPAFDRDIEKIMYVPAYNRYNDKTQVFSFLHNDDVSRRGLHVQYVSKIARNIGGLLGLNTKLIEAIALGHDIGHTPFGHAGERFLNDVYHKHSGRYFFHNLHSVRVLDKLYQRNLSLQTLDGILCHNGELEMKKIKSGCLKSFEEFDKCVEDCYTKKNAVNHLISSTLEGCVVRMADIIAYLGKDRIDALQIGALDGLDMFETNIMGRMNTTIISNLTVDLVANSYGRDCIQLSDEMFEDLSCAKRQNYELIYNKEAMTYNDTMHLEEMISELYERCKSDLLAGNMNAPIFKHHVIPLCRNSKSYDMDQYLEDDADQVVVDYIASMTDSYFMIVYEHLFPHDKKSINFRGYFQLD